MKQVRLPIVDVAANVKQLTSGLKTWDDMLKAYPLFESKAADEEGKQE